MMEDFMIYFMSAIIFLESFCK